MLPDIILLLLECPSFFCYHTLQILYHCHIRHTLPSLLIQLVLDHSDFLLIQIRFTSQLHYVLPLEVSLVYLLS